MDLAKAMHKPLVLGVCYPPPMPPTLRRSPMTDGSSASPKAGLTYASAGVNLEEKDSFTEGLVGLMRRTHGP